MKTLIVTNPFGGYDVGACITDPAEIRDIRSGEHAQHVVVSQATDPEPASKAKKSTPQE